MLMYPQCHLHSALFAIGMLALIFVHAMKYMHRANSPLRASSHEPNTCIQTTNIFEPFSLFRNTKKNVHCFSLYQFVIKTNDEMTKYNGFEHFGKHKQLTKNKRKRKIHERASINANCSWFLFSVCILFCFVLKVLCFKLSVNTPFTLATPMQPFCSIQLNKLDLKFKRTATFHSNNSHLKLLQCHEIRASLQDLVGVSLYKAQHLG